MGRRLCFRIPILSFELRVREFQFRLEAGGEGAPPSSHFHSLHLTIHQDPARGHPPACSQMHGAGNKINLVAIVFPALAPPPRELICYGREIKKSKLGCAKNYDRPRRMSCVYEHVCVHACVCQYMRVCVRMRVCMC